MLLEIQFFSILYLLIKFVLISILEKKMIFTLNENYIIFIIIIIIKC